MCDGFICGSEWGSMTISCEQGSSAWVFIRLGRTLPASFISEISITGGYNEGEAKLKEEEIGTAGK